MKQGEPTAFFADDSPFCKCASGVLVLEKHPSDLGGVLLGVFQFLGDGAREDGGGNAWVRRDQRGEQALAKEGAPEGCTEFIRIARVGAMTEDEIRKRAFKDGRIFCFTDGRRISGKQFLVTLVEVLEIGQQRFPIVVRKITWSNLPKRTDFLQTRLVWGGAVGKDRVQLCTVREMHKLFAEELFKVFFVEDCANCGDAIETMYQEEK